jgi:hypothetical protein
MKVSLAENAESLESAAKILLQLRLHCSLETPGVLTWGIIGILQYGLTQ